METAPRSFWYVFYVFLWSVPWSHVRSFYSWSCSPWFQPVRMRRAPRKEATYGFGSKWPKKQQIPSFLVFQSYFFGVNNFELCLHFIISTQASSIMLVDFAWQVLLSFDGSCFDQVHVAWTACANAGRSEGPWARVKVPSSVSKMLGIFFFQDISWQGSLRRASPMWRRIFNERGRTTSTS